MAEVGIVLAQLTKCGDCGMTTSSARRKAQAIHEARCRREQPASHLLFCHLYYLDGTDHPLGFPLWRQFESRWLER